MSKIRKSFILHHDSLNVLDDLTDEQAGLLFKAIKAYHLGDELQLDVLTNIAMSPFRNQFDRDAIKYENLCEKNRLIAENRYNTKSTSGKAGNQPLPEATKSTDNDSKSDSKSKSDNDSKKEVTKDIVAKARKYSDVDYQFAKFAYGLIIKIAPKQKANLESWAETIRLMRVIDKITHQDMANVFKWANADSFWGTNILSVTKFRKQFPQLQAKMKGASNGYQGTGRKESSHERIKRENDIKYRGQNESGLAVGENDGHLGRAVGEGERELTIARLDNTDFVDY